jgi:hypothetical protein
MKRFFIFLTVFLLVSNVFAQNPVTLRAMASAWESAGMTADDFYGFNLPKIRGKWYFVDASSGNNYRDGLTKGTAVASLATAYGKCTSGAGDGIVILGRSISGTTNYTTLTSRIAWAKYGITVVGVGGGSTYNSQCRVTNPATASGGDSLAALIYVTGRFNTFINIAFTNTVDCQTYTAFQTAQHAAVQIGGVRNRFINCHFNAYDVNTAGASTNTYAAYLTTGVWLRVGSDETEFIGCYFGSSSYDPGNTVSSWIYLNGAAAQHFFKNCTFIQQVSTGTAFGAYESSGATVLNGIDVFEDCTFAVWRANTHANICASWFIGTLPNTGNIVMRDCATCGFTALDATGGNELIWTNQPAANGAGGITTTP